MAPKKFVTVANRNGTHATINVDQIARIDSLPTDQSGRRIVIYLAGGPSVEVFSGQSIDRLAAAIDPDHGELAL